MHGVEKMIISEKQIMQLITIVHAHVTNMHILGEYKRVGEIQDLLVEINEQQSKELKDLE